MKGNCIGSEMRQGPHQQVWRTQRDSSGISMQADIHAEASLEIHAVTGSKICNHQQTTSHM